MHDADLLDARGLNHVHQVDADRDFAIQVGSLVELLGGGRDVERSDLEEVFPASDVKDAIGGRGNPHIEPRAALGSVHQPRKPREVGRVWTF